MDNKVAITTYLSTIESKKQTKQTRTETIRVTKYFDGCQIGRGCRGMGEEVRGLGSTSR